MFEQVGYFSKTQGLKGHLQLQVSRNFDIENCEVLMVGMPGGQAPQFISEFRDNKKGFVVLLDEVDSIDKAKMFVGKGVSVKQELVFKDNLPDFSGYVLFDKVFGELGPVTGVEDTGNGLLITVMHGDKQVLLPFNKDFIGSIDDGTKCIYYKAPEGLIQMYL
jgi:ribosomal 30S subunit maturation factor RimM